MQAQNVQQDATPLPLRAHTILGVCEAIGEDFGFNPVWLRVPFATTVLLSPMMAIGAYLALGVIVMVSRLLFPKPKAVEAKARVESAAEAANEQQEMARAA